MKLNLTFPVEDRHEFKPSFRSRRAAARNPEHLKHARFMKINGMARLPRNEGEIVASFGAADLIRHGDGRWELRGGSPADHAAAREWSSHFQHEAVFPSAALPVSAPQPKPAKAIHNRVLIADDDALVRGSLAAVLEYEGFAVDEAQNGIEAVTRAIARTPDLVLLDINMPNWDGWAVLGQLDQAAPCLPVIVITARPNQYPKAVQLGVDAFMEKPLNIPILVRAIKRLTSEDGHRHVNRITNRAFVTQLLGGPES